MAVAEKKKTYVEDIERTLYDIKDADNSSYKSGTGLTEEVIRDISAKKHRITAATARTA